jgi:hypothetical protein
MPRDSRRFAELFGAKHVGQMPEVGGGPFGMARLAHLMHQRLTPSKGERPGRPTDPSWVTRCKVPMSAATLQQLGRLAEQISTDQRRVSPMQVAAQLLEEAVRRIQSDTEEKAPDSNAEPPRERGERKRQQRA